MRKYRLIVKAMQEESHLWAIAIYVFILLFAFPIVISHACDPGEGSGGSPGGGDDGGSVGGPGPGASGDPSGGDVPNEYTYDPTVDKCDSWIEQLHGRSWFLDLIGLGDWYDREAECTY